MFGLSDSVIINSEKELLEYIKHGKVVHSDCVVLEYPYWITELNECYITTKDKPISGIPLPIKVHNVKWSD